MQYLEQFQDEAFAGHLHNHLQENGIRCWFAPENLKDSEPDKPTMYHTVRLPSRLLLILSQHSIKSDWIEAEVEAAFEQESKHRQPVLLPVCLDSAARETTQVWADQIRQTRPIIDFSAWQDPAAYQVALEQLLDKFKEAEPQAIMA